LKGNLILTHEGRYTKEMKPYDQDTFSGEWPTSSVGKVTDFNLMLKHGATGSLNHQHLKAQAQIQHHSGAERTFVYVAAGQLRFQDQLLETGDLLAYDATTLELKAEVNSDLIFIEVDLSE
jgi:environmental stress-induced protein Ves